MPSVHRERTPAPAPDLGRATGALVDALGERVGRQDLAAIGIELLIEAGPGGGGDRRRPLAEEVISRQLDQRAGRARRHARLIAVGAAVIALVGDPADPRDPAGAGAKRQGLLLLEAGPEVAVEGGATVLDVDHVDRPVRAALGARRAAGAGGLVDHDLLLAGVVLDRVVGARIDAPLIGAGPAGVDEVEHPELVATQGQALGAVALLAGDLALLAVDAAVELADPDRLARHRDALADEEVEDLLLDPGDAVEAGPRELDGAPEARLEEREAHRDVGDQPLRQGEDGRRRGGVERAPARRGPRSPPRRSTGRRR
jgi:hypothetical protein